VVAHRERYDSVDDVMRLPRWSAPNYFLQWVANVAEDVITWWGGKRLDQLKGRACRDSLSGLCQPAHEAARALLH
jgi:hypothetical protein